MAANAAPSQEPVDASFPVALARDPLAAAALLDGLALLELLGARWMLAVTFKNWTPEIHEHTLDEVRHTKMVQDSAKRLRWAMSPAEIVREAAMGKACYLATEEYLGALSKRIFLLAKRKLGEKWSVPAYIVLAFLIERRIMKIYPHLAHHGATEELRATARELVGDERRHLSHVSGHLPESLELTGATREEMLEMEEELAAKWLRKVCDATLQ
jgi:hypothetical protein